MDKLDDATGLELSGNGNIGLATNTGTSPVTTTVVVTPTFENGAIVIPVNGTLQLQLIHLHRLIK